jgi:hypothetical protein
MNDRIAFTVIDELGDALFQLVFRVDADVAEHGASGFGKAPLNRAPTCTAYSDCGKPQREPSPMAHFGSVRPKPNSKSLSDHSDHHLYPIILTIDQH